MRVRNPVNVLENSIPERWKNLNILILHLSDLEEAINHIKPTITISCISHDSVKAVKLEHFFYFFFLIFIVPVLSF